MGRICVQLAEGCAEGSELAITSATVYERFAEGDLVARFPPWSRRSSYIDSNVPSSLNFLVEEYWGGGRKKPEYKFCSM